jgi:hypothetical protein
VRAQHPQLPLLPLLGHQVQVQKRGGHQRVIGVAINRRGGEQWWLQLFI